MVAATPSHVRGRLRQRSGPEPTGYTAESNQSYVLPLGADDTGSQIVGPDRGRCLPPAMRASSILRARLRKDKHTARARAISTYSASGSHVAGTRWHRMRRFRSKSKRPSRNFGSIPPQHIFIYATERSRWHLTSRKEPNAMDSVLAHWFSAGRDLLSARHPAFLCIT